MCRVGFGRQGLSAGSFAVSQVAKGTRKNSFRRPVDSGGSDGKIPPLVRENFPNGRDAGELQSSVGVLIKLFGKGIVGSREDVSPRAPSVPGRLGRSIQTVGRLRRCRTSGNPPFTGWASSVRWRSV